MKPRGMILAWVNITDGPPIMFIVIPNIWRLGFLEVKYLYFK